MRFDAFQSLELPVGVRLGFGGDGNLVVVSISNGLILRVGHAWCSVILSTTAVRGDNCLDFVEVLGLDGGNEGVRVISELLVWDEAFVDLLADVNTHETHEDTSLESGVSGGGNRVLSGLNGPSSDSEHLGYLE